MVCNEDISQVSPPKQNKDPVEDEVKDPVKAVRDSRLLADPRVLKNLLKLEETCVPKTPDYIRNCQPELNPSMRKIVTDWMLQVYLIFLFHISRTRSGIKSDANLTFHVYTVLLIKELHISGYNHVVE